MSKISRTTLPRQYDHIAVIAHGAHPEYRLEFDAYVASTASNIYQGSVVRLNSAGEFILWDGTASAATKTNKPVPMISMKNLYDPDVTTGYGALSITYSGDTATAVDAGYLKNTYSAVGGKITAIPCTGGYEIETTEFVASTDWAINDAVLIGAGTAAGKLIHPGSTAEIVGGTAGAVAGFVSKKPFDTPEYGGKRISFFTNFIPAADTK